MLDSIKQAVDKISCALPMERQIVGVRLLYTEQEFMAHQGKLPVKKMPYCVMVRMATQGIAMKSDLQHSGCGGATRALGLEPAAEGFHSGCEYNSFGIYENLEVAKLVASNVTLCKKPIFGVATAPITAFEQPPHMVIIVTNSYNAMRIIQGYTYKFGNTTHYKMAGNQALCSECTAYPFENDSINISMLCSGTRFLCAWGQNEMAIGMPFAKFLETAEGVWQSVNGAETNGHKKEIVLRANDIGLCCEKIEQNGAYFIKETKEKS